MRSVREVILILSGREGKNRLHTEVVSRNNSEGTSEIDIPCLIEINYEGVFWN